MTNKKREKPLKLDMDFNEALERFAGVELSELPDNMKLGQKGKQRKRDAEASRNPDLDADPPISDGGDASDAS